LDAWLAVPGNKDRIESLAVLLARAGQERPEDTLKDPSSLQQFELTDAEGHLGRLFVQSRGANPPRWSRFFVPQVEPSALGAVSSTAAVMHVPIDDRAMLLTFGQGRHLLKPGCWEDRFGIRTALNSIGADRLRSIDKHTLDTLGMHSRIQVSKEAAPSDFGIDIERDLVRAITGTPIDSRLADRLSGFDALRVSTRVTLQTLRPHLARLLEQFRKDTYKETFPWLEHVSDVTDKALADTLDVLMLAKIAENRTDRCWLAIPDPIDWAGIGGFRYRGRGRRPVHHDIHLETFLQDCETSATDLTIEFLREHDICAVDDEGSPHYSWSAYKCIYCEIDYNDDTYLLSAGRWYKVASDFVRQVNDFYRCLPLLDVGLPDYDDASEEDYNQRAADHGPGRYANMDRKLVSVGGGYSKVEFCDLISSGRDLIHVKRYGGSGVLSHLFQQGTVSGQLFASDADFRASVNRHLPDELKLADTALRPEVPSYRIIFAVVSGESGSGLALPFFSRLSLRHAMQTLQGYGYKVGLSKVRVTDERVKLRKFINNKKKK
jgi:uncharacterized protein (TIGR04141 family)